MRFWIELQRYWRSPELATGDVAVTLQSIFKNISKRLTKAATVNTVYGDPLVAEVKTIIPVAKVRFGFGAGFGEFDFGDSGDSEHPVSGKGTRRV